MRGIMNSTVSTLLQENSSVEYVDSQKNPIATIATSQLVFGQTHNGIECSVGSNYSKKRAESHVVHI